MSEPTIHVTNASTKRLHGPGKIFNIMAAPRIFERFSGNVPSLTPNSRDLEAVRVGAITTSEYKRRFDLELASRLHGPGTLMDKRGREVNDGDTLVCACSKDAAARGECHRVWAAAALRRAGWRVILDVAELP